MKTLPNNFYTMPTIANTTMDRKDLKELLLENDGWVIACGRMYDIISKNIGVGVYRVSLKLRN